MKDVNTLEPFAHTEDINYEDIKRDSVGLLVYNVAVAQDIVPGVYCWDGNHWLKIASTEEGLGGGIDNPDPTITNIDDPAALTLPNSYILQPGKSLVISVIKGYAVWKQLLNKDEASLAGEVTVDLLWQTKQNMIKGVSLYEGDKGKDTKIRIDTNELDGNALIALKINGVVKWSWHIWVTYYEPMEGGTVSNNGYEMMDRNLGALYTTASSLLSKGMLYQWGRKNPFPGAGSLTSDNVEREIYDINNNVVTLSFESAPNADNRELSISNPMVFYTNNGDWTSPTTVGPFWNGTGGSKGLTDPCPSGWKVPIDASVWAGLPTDFEYTDESGLNWNKNGYEGGFYPSAGYREATTGSLKISERAGYYWTASLMPGTSNAYRLYFREWDFNSNNVSPRAQGNSVRCVKE